MCQNSMNGFNDTSLQYANTGMDTAATAYPALVLNPATTNHYVTVFTAALTENSVGSVVKSIIIKAQQATLQGMVRLFIYDGTTALLYKEVPIPVVPMAATTPVPAPQYIMYETILLGDLKLPSGYSLLATTQNTQNFNVIVEGIDWAYPATTPTLCCNLVQNAANTSIGTAAYNTALDGSGTINTIFTAGATLGDDACGSLIKNITIKATQATQEGAVRIFISSDGTTWYLMQEVYIPLTAPSAFEPSYKQVIAANYNLQAGYLIGATTQNDESYAITIEGEDWTYPS